MSHFVNKLRRVKPSQILDVWKLPIAVVALPFYRYRHPDLWIVCEDAMEARDNGLWLFRYVREKHPEQDIVYAIKKASADYEKVASLGETVEFGSLQHWVKYFASSKKISSQKAGNPNAAIFYFLEVYGLLKDKRIFLQHGITINNAKWLYYPVTKMSKFICGAMPEFKYVKDYFEYPDNAVEYTGFCRFDGLHNGRPDGNLILIMPSWREWIADEDYRLKEYEGTTEISKTNYFQRWNELLSSSRLKELHERYGVRFVFFPHRNMQKYMEFFPQSNDFLEVASAHDYDIQELIKRASLMVTDYSSVFFDFVYMKKPVLFYQFDYERFRQAQYGEGWFDYKNNAFGASFTLCSEVLDAIECSIGSNFAISEEFAMAHAQCFPLYDGCNCERVYEIVANS